MNYDGNYTLSLLHKNRPQSYAFMGITGYFPSCDLSSKFFQTFYMVEIVNQYFFTLENMSQYYRYFKIWVYLTCKWAIVDLVYCLGSTIWFKNTNNRFLFTGVGPRIKWTPVIWRQCWRRFLFHISGTIKGKYLSVNQVFYVWKIPFVTIYTLLEKRNKDWSVHTTPYIKGS